MIHSVKFTCLLDTNVIYPIQTRDMLLWFAHYELYTPKWSPHIFEEWANVMRRKKVEEHEMSYCNKLNAEELEKDWFAADDKVGICGATSTPMWLMEKVKAELLSF